MLTPSPDLLEKLKIETINGKLQAWGPVSIDIHLNTTAKLGCAFYNHLEGTPYRMYYCGLKVIFSDQNKVYPDITICKKEIVQKDGIYGVPDLIIEVLSPGSAKRDRYDKKICMNTSA